MFAVISPEKIELPPGSLIQIPGTWEDYEALSRQLGDRSIPRLKYRFGTILFMSPLPQHGRDVHIISSVITTILDYLNKEYEAFTPVTMKLPQRSGIEPDYCVLVSIPLRLLSTRGLTASILITGKLLRGKKELTGKTSQHQIW